MAVPWTDEEDRVLIERWREHSHADIARDLDGRTERAVRNRCWRLGLTHDRSWTDDELATLLTWYEKRDGAALHIHELASQLGRRTSSVSAKAREFGLTLRDRPKTEELKALLRESRAAYIAANGHPRGMAGKKHSPDTIDGLRKSSKERWARMTEDERASLVLKMNQAKVAKSGNHMSRRKTSWKQGWRTIAGRRIFFRSRWEANYARFLQLRQENGDILQWDHEPETFWFEGIKRGAVSYLPDFRVTLRSGAIEYHEVKGWMDDRSKTKIRRMAKYHPEVKLLVINGKAYREIERKLGGAINGWET